ncbi:MAG: L-threonylcarbamoyladenylate synthase [Anaerolineae bacterium]|jgi:L-threonylcarbamoyladenylate synthase|nr:L-threonylcarbamoyladenylate synthase [Anaerolineae bacterium]
MGYTAETRVLQVNPQHPEPEVITAAAGVLRAGGLVAFPTETVYGLGANALDSQAIERIYLAKRRPAYDPLIAHVYDFAQVQQLAIDLPEIARPLTEHFWPGPLTLVFKRAPHVPESIAQGLDTVAIRMPAHPVARALLDQTGFPIAAPSANTFTRPSATTAAHVLEDLQGRVDLVLDGGASTIGLESTVIDLTQDPPVILRPGGVLLEDLKGLIPQLAVNPKYLSNPMPSASPGMMIKHYSPRANVMLFDGPIEVVLIAMADTAQRLIANGKKVGILTLEEEAVHFTGLGARIISLGKREDLSQIGRVLFGAMRALDVQGIDAILVHNFEKIGLGEAISDRLLRAASGRVIRVE